MCVGTSASGFAYEEQPLFVTQAALGGERWARCLWPTTKPQAVMDR